MYYENFEKLCDIKGIKPADVSKATGISTATLSNWKKGNYTPKQDKLQLIADFFKVSVDYLMTGETKNEFLALGTEHAKVIKLYSQLSKEDKGKIIELMELYINKKG